MKSTQQIKNIVLSYTTWVSVAILLFMLFCPYRGQATILTVKQDGTGNFTHIQQAYLAAVSGDTILVYPGTYFENLIIGQKKDITLSSIFLFTQDREDILTTIIDGSHIDRCIYIYNTGNANIHIIGFTICNGYACNASSYFDFGGGICIREASSVVLISNIIKDNLASAGGGILLAFSTLHMIDNLIYSNRATSAGGGIAVGHESTIQFDAEKKNSIYLNYGPQGGDISKNSYSGSMNIILDTCTVLNPDYHFIYSYTKMNFPNNDITLSVDHGKLTPVNQDLYVDPATGDDANDGLTPATALKTASYACKLIASDSTNPLTIHLLDGIYSPSTNQERFPFNGRSYVSLVGESKENTIFDADSSYYFYKSSGYQTSFSIKNITMRNAFEGEENMISGGMYFLPCVNPSIENILIYNCTQKGMCGLGLDFPDKLTIKNLECRDLKGGVAIGFGNDRNDKKRTFRCENIIIRNCGPGTNPFQNGGEGGGITILGYLYEDDYFSGSITNLQITENLRISNPIWGKGSQVALAIGYRVRVNLINATIGNNICRGEETFATNVDEGSEVNFYNTIMYGDSLKELSLGMPTGSYFSATANISYSNFEGGEAAIKNWQNMHTLNWLEGNMDEDPRWVGTGDTAYYLQYDSPCRNSGTPMYESGMSPPYIKEEEGKYVLYMHNRDTVHLPATDLAGRPRISGNRIDMGAYEYQDTTTSVQEYGQLQDAYQLSVYPNPFYVHAFVDFKMEKQGHVQLVITDMNGQRVKTLLDASMPRGDYHLIWKGDNDYGTTLRTGTYLLTLYNNGQQITTVKVQKQRF
jgi:hypothetical protein